MDLTGIGNFSKLLAGGIDGTHIPIATSIASRSYHTQASSYFPLYSHK